MSFILNFFIFDNEYAVMMKSECIYDVDFILSGSHLKLEEKTKEFLSRAEREGRLFNNSKIFQ